VSQDHTHKTVNSLSGGTRRKLVAAIALSTEPRVCFLDEPTTGVGAPSLLNSLLFLCVYISHTIQLTTQKLSVEPRNSASAEALAFFSFSFALYGAASLFSNRAYHRSRCAKSFGG